MAIGVTEDHEALAASVRGWAERAGLRASAREALEAPEARPAWWSGLAAQGLLGLHVPEESGGSGAGGVELAVVVEELGRALAHGPSLPTVLASTVLREVGGPVAKELLPALAEGESTAAVALSTGSLVAVDGAVSGTVDVLGAGHADLLVLGTEESWFVVDAAEVTVTALDGLDATRRPARVELHGLTPTRSLPGLDTHQVRVLTGAVIAAEAAGLAGWALDTAVEYAKTREQFGRVIGAFQAVKHSCADMLVRAEQARATAWDAARALDDPAGPERDLAVSKRAQELEPTLRAELLHAIATHHDRGAARTAEAVVLYHANQLDAQAATRPVGD